jgi:3-isopropylmalate dehydrogenase
MAVPITPTISVFPSDVHDAFQTSNGHLTASNALPSFSSSAPKNRILILPGDHVGPEVMTEALKLLGVLEDTLGHKFECTHDICGGCSIDKYGVPITDAVLQKATEVDAILFGSVGGPEWGTRYPNPESGLLRLRQHIGAFANIRPCAFYSQSLVERSPLKREIVEGVNFIILRENCGGAYYGKKVDDLGDGYASDTWEYTRKEVERCAHVAAALAKTMGKDGRGGGGDAVVWSADKANVLASGRLWRKVVSEVFKKNYPEMQLRHQLADSLSMIMMQDPRRFNGVVVTDNTFGDMLSDQAGGVVGTLGVLPSASLCGVPGEGRRCNGIYEPVHGSAPDIAGQGIVNPVAQILSTAMMLRYSFNMHMEAESIEKAVEKVLDSKDIGGLEIRTSDLGGTASTSEVGDAVCNVLREMLSDVRGGIPKRHRLSSLVNINERPRTAHREENERWKAEISKLPKEEFTSLAL